jgi:hypothetical protein
MAIHRDTDARSPEAVRWLEQLKTRFAERSAWDEHPTVDEQLAEQFERLGLDIASEPQTAERVGGA